MAQNPKQLTIHEAEFVTPCTRLLEIECLEGGAFADVGGKYIILHTGLLVADRPVKRAYSLMPVPERPGRARIAVKALDGPGSRELHRAGPGARFGFSGPWGKLIPEQGLGERTLLVATDTGVTTALGIVAQAQTRGDARRLVEVLWLHSAAETFLGGEFVSCRLRQAGVTYQSLEIGPVNSPERTLAVAQLVQRARQQRISHLIATGDGRILTALREAVQAELPEVDFRLECFFNNPEKKSG